jgi:hypothetical protein
MSEDAIGNAVAMVPPTEDRGIIATCRGAWGIAYASQSEGAEVDAAALTIYIASCEKLEELGYSVEESEAELEIMRLEGDSPYDGDAWVEPAVFLLESWRGRPERAGRGHGRSSSAGRKCVLCVGTAQG